MQKEYIIDDSGLQSKHLITKKTVLEFLPEDFKESIKGIHVVIDDNTPVWLIIMKGKMGLYTYTPYSHKIIYKPLGYKFARIYLCHFARYLRKEDKPTLDGHKYRSIYFYHRNFMFLFKEVKELWYYQDDSNDPGYSSVGRRFFKVY